MWEKGVNEEIIDEMVGHTTKAMAKRYRHIRNDHIRKAISTVWENSDPCPPHEEREEGGKPPA
jgi:integrase